MKDQDLDKLLKSLRETAPSEDQIRRWQLATQAETLLRPQISPRRHYLQLTAALAAGIVAGALIFGQRFQSDKENSNRNATIEMVITKLD